MDERTLAGLGRCGGLPHQAGSLPLHFSIDQPSRISLYLSHHKHEAKKKKKKKIAHPGIESPGEAAMGFLACAGYTLVGAGPPAAIFYEFIVSSPFVLLVSLASAFFWVTVLLANSVVWRSLSWMTHQGQTEALRVLPLISFFATEELLRPMVFRQTKRATAALERRAVALRHPRLTKLERMRIFLGIGAGQGVAHSCLFFLNTVVTSYR